MDYLTIGRDAIERCLQKHADIPFAQGEIDSEVIFDRENNHWVLFAIGWDGFKRIYAPLIHVEVKEGKFWVQHDGTEEGIAGDLVEAGVPKDQIVLAFQHKSRRKWGEFAPA
ncbi:XisI protein [Armatimonas sp.]|uniref:XisI protein n=1 Tax=Armatimonas sp. TaxID=1872638 RepID=UPI0037507D12